MAGFSRMPSTALIFLKPARPMAKPVLPLLPVDWFCFGMLKIYHIACHLATLTLGSPVFAGTT